MKGWFVSEDGRSEKRVEAREGINRAYFGDDEHVVILPGKNDSVPSA